MKFAAKLDRAYCEMITLEIKSRIKNNRRKNGISDDKTEGPYANGDQFSSRPKKTRPRPTQTRIEIYRFVPGGGVELSNKNERSLVYGCLMLGSWL